MFSPLRLCASVLLILFLTIPAQSQPNFETPEPLPGQVNLSNKDEGGPWLSGDGLRMYFYRDQTSGSSVNEAIFVAERSSISSPFGAPSVLAGLGASSEKRYPWLAPDERTIYFRGTSSGKNAIFRADRSAVVDPFSNLVVLSYLDDTIGNNGIGAASLSDDRTRIVLEASGELYEATRATVATNFGNPVYLNTLSTAYSEGHQWLSGNGLWVFFMSRRPGGSGAADIYYSERSNLGNDFSLPRNVCGLNSADDEWNAIYSDTTGYAYFSRHPYGLADTRDIYRAKAVSLALPSRIRAQAGEDFSAVISATGPIGSLSCASVDLRFDTNHMSFVDASSDISGGTIVYAVSGNVFLASSAWSTPIAGQDISLSTVSFELDPLSAPGDTSTLQFASSTGGPAANACTVVTVIPVSLQVPSLQVHAGQIVSIPLRSVGAFYTDNVPVNFDLQYDPSIVTPLGFTPTDGNLQSYSILAGVFSATLSLPGPGQGTDTLLGHIVFEVSGTAQIGEVSDLVFLNGTGGTSVSNGSLIVSDPLNVRNWDRYR